MVASWFFLFLPIAIGDNLNSITNCSFDTGMCGWTQDVTDNFDWSRHSGSTSSSSTGPSGDHTTGKGHYMYIETSSPREAGDKARLVSPTVLCENQTFLMFYYHMYGSDINTLNVYFSQIGSFGSPVWTKSGSQGSGWNKASVQYTSRMGKIVFEGIRGTDFKGDIAVDDISLSGGYCCEVSAPPRVHLEPDSDVLKIKEGKKLIVKCVVDNNETPTSIVWSHNGRNSSGSTFRIQTAAQSDEGRLTCTARTRERTNPGQADAFIRVVEKPLEPALVPDSDVLLVNEGDNLAVNCVVNGAKPGVTSITWSHNNSKSSGSTFYIQGVTQSDEGRLTCTADNGPGTSPGSTDTFIRVLEKKPVLTLVPDSDVLYVDKGDNLTVKCVVNGGKPAVTSITWTHNNHTSSGSTFYIQDVSRSDEGRLTCTADNGPGKSRGSTDTFIRVLEKNEESLITGTSTWTPNGVGYVVIGVAAVLVLVLIFITIHLSRKRGSASVQGHKKSKTASDVASKTECDEEESEADYEEPCKLVEDSTAKTETEVQTKQERLGLTGACNPVYDEEEEGDYEVPYRDTSSPSAWKTQNKKTHMFHVSEPVEDYYENQEPVEDYCENQEALYENY